MIRFLIRVAINLASAAIGLLLAAWLLDDFHIQASGFLIAVGVFTVAQSLFTPWVFKVARRHASALLGGIGIISTLIALLITSFFPGGIEVTSFSTWVVAALIVWLCTALGGWLLVAYVFKRRAGSGGSPAA